MWTKGKDIVRVKEITKRPRFALAQDRKSRLVQALISRATIPIITLGDKLLTENEPLDKDETFEIVIDTLRLLSAASATQI